MAQGWRGTNVTDEFARVAIGLVALDGVEEVLGALGLGAVSYTHLDVYKRQNASGIASR